MCRSCQAFLLLRCELANRVDDATSLRAVTAQRCAFAVSPAPLFDYPWVTSPCDVTDPW